MRIFSRQPQRQQQTNCYTLGRNLLGQIVLKPGIVLCNKKFLTHPHARQDLPAPHLLGAEHGRQKLFMARASYFSNAHRAHLEIGLFDPEQLILKVEVVNKRQERVLVNSRLVETIGHWRHFSWEHGVNYDELLLFIRPESIVDVLEQRQIRVNRIRTRLTRVTIEQKQETLLPLLA